MQLDELIRKIMEAERALGNELERDDLGLSLDYAQIAQDNLKKLTELCKTLSGDDLVKAKEFATSYAEHIKEQIKNLALEQAKVGDEYRKVKGKHKISNQYFQFQKKIKNNSTNSIKA